MLALRRSVLSLTQKEVYIESGVSERTIRDFEHNGLLPGYNKIEALSKAYKLHPMTLINISAKTKYIIDVDFYENFSNINTALEIRPKIASYIESLDEILDASSLSSFNYLFYKQYRDFLAGLSLVYEKDYSTAFNYFISSLRLSLENFNLTSIDFYLANLRALSKIEIRNLYELSLCLFYLGDKDLSNKIIKSLAQGLDTNWEFYENILSLYAINLSRNELYADALVYINQTIDFLHSNLYFKNLPLAYYNRSRIKLHLDDKTFKDDLVKALDLCKLLGEDYLTKILLDKCQKFNIEL
ncbi:helix-turn-helix domain-containing protein [Neofamilia massiliensis]|uniref:helix-turn-helix domain-containing protein n=1 Tax=Neofamilia massiliensis TaxID=1673724 RepID=UPI0006BB653C|nr:helix-turn-helix transcriptional regulator [Neofamilia massiliensis]